MPGRGDQARYRGRCRREMAGDQPAVFRGLAEYYPQEGSSGRRRPVEGRAGQVRKARQREPWLGRLKPPAHTCPAGTTVKNSQQKDARSFRSEENTSELQSLMRISSAVICLKEQKS